MEKPSDYKDILKPFDEYLLMRANLELSEEQEILILTQIWGTLKQKVDFKKYRTCFFDYYKLKASFSKTLWKYALKNSNLEKQVEAMEVVPFAALNCDGRAIRNGGNVFAEMMNWGVLCLDLQKVKDNGCPVIWVYKGKILPWSKNISSFKITPLDK